MAKLTDKQEMFCLEYMKDLNATQAAIRAGYSETSARQVGYDNMTKAAIQDRVAELMQERVAQTKIDALWVLNQAVKVHNRCMQAEKVTTANGEPVLDEDGSPVYKFEHAGANKALEIIGKHVDVKAFEKESTTVVTNNIMPVPVADSVEEWQAAAKANQEKLLNGS